MRTFSEAFKSKIKDAQRVEHVRGYVGSAPFEDNNIIHLSYQNQCSDNKDVTFGSARIGQLTATFCGLNIPRYSWRGLKIKLDYGLEIDDEGTIEWIDDLLTATIAKAEWTNTGINITAYDCLSDLDIPINFDQTTGQIFGMLTLVSNNTGVLLGITEEECAALPNGTEIFGLIQPNDITTYRDFVSSIATAVGGFATATGDGKLLIKSFADSEVVFKFEARDRVVGSVFSDYITNYDGIVITDSETGAPMYYFAEGAADGISINIGANPLLQLGTEAVKNARRQRLAEVAHSIAYVPYELSILNCPVFDLGDLIECDGGVAGAEKITCCVMAIDWTFKTTTSMKGFGADPNLTAGKSKTDKALTSILRQNKTNELTYYNFVNAEAKTIGTSEVSLYSLRFSTAQSTTVEWWHEMKVLSALSGASSQALTLAYYLDDELMDYEPADTWNVNGYHTVHLGGWFENVEPSVSHKFEVRAVVSSGTASIGIGDLHVLLKGQAMNASDKFDGTITLTDDITPFLLGRLIASLTESTVTLDLHRPLAVTVNDTIYTYTLGRLIAPLTETSVSLTAMLVQYTRITEDEEYVRVTEDGGIRLTEGNA